MHTDPADPPTRRSGVWLGAGGPDARDAVEPDIDLVNGLPSAASTRAILRAVAYARTEWCDTVELRHLLLALHAPTSTAAARSLRTQDLRLSGSERALVARLDGTGGRADASARPGWMPFSRPHRSALRRARQVARGGQIDTAALLEGLTATEEGRSLLDAGGVDPHRLLLEVRMRRNAGSL